MANGIFAIRDIFPRRALRYLGDELVLLRQADPVSCRADDVLCLGYITSDIVYRRVDTTGQTSVQLRTYINPRGAVSTLAAQIARGGDLRARRRRPLCPRDNLQGRSAHLDTPVGRRYRDRADKRPIPSPLMVGRRSRRRQSHAVRDYP